ncbi:hypothetical protein OF83DRAFT_1070794 [Amylostereum chailletii]|nr:hypothetical protein OF83DRAFT_1070794 [Amylostereum chailletii]
MLNQGILKELWKITSRTTLPSSMARGPARFGTPGQGRIKADEWRTICLVLLPITLIIEWGNATDGEIERDLLDNFMALVTTVKWATRHMTSERIRNIVQTSYHFYCESLVEIFGEGFLSPNHHLTFHLIECLTLFGPVIGWWAFPFEQYNGIIQRIRNNGRFGS